MLKVGLLCDGVVFCVCDGFVCVVEVKGLVCILVIFSFVFLLLFWLDDLLVRVSCGILSVNKFWGVERVLCFNYSVFLFNLLIIVS